MRRSRNLWLWVLLVALVAAGVYPAAARHVRAASLLIELMGKKGPLTPYAVSSERVELTSHGRLQHLVLYHPRRANPPGLVLVHGLVYRGVDYPPFVRFAEQLAGAGFEVITPDLTLGEFNILGDHTDRVVDSFVELRRRMGPKAPIGILGISISGGIGLVAAARPEISRDVAFVLGLGADDDLSRVMHFFLDDTIAGPDGALHPQRADRGGLLLLAGGFAKDLFAPEDVVPAREVLWKALHDPKGARELSKSLRPDALARVLPYLDERQDLVKDAMVKLLARDQAGLAAESPHEQLQKMAAPVILIHGLSDDTVPSTEALWLAGDLPPDRMASFVLTPLLGHINLQAKTTLRDRWELVHGMATMFKLAGF